MKIIDEVKEITANQVAKKQDAAKLNFPKIIEKIKAQASLGFSECIIQEFGLNEYDKKLLEAEGFCVRLVDNEYKKGYDVLKPYKDQAQKKEWEITW